MTRSGLGCCVLKDTRSEMAYRRCYWTLTEVKLLNRQYTLEILFLVTTLRLLKLFLINKGCLLPSSQPGRKTCCFELYLSNNDGVSKSPMASARWTSDQEPSPKAAVRLNPWGFMLLGDSEAEMAPIPSSRGSGTGQRDLWYLCSPPGQAGKRCSLPLAPICAG